MYGATVALAIQQCKEGDLFQVPSYIPAAFGESSSRTVYVLLDDVDKPNAAEHDDASCITGQPIAIEKNEERVWYLGMVKRTDYVTLLLNLHYRYLYQLKFSYFLWPSPRRTLQLR